MALLPLPFSLALLRRRRFPTSRLQRRAAGCGCARAAPGGSGSRWRSLRGIGGGGRAVGSFSSGQVDGALAAGFSEDHQTILSIIWIVTQGYHLKCKLQVERAMVTDVQISYYGRE
uniref:Uncharacterized protein n=1 Tax=Oryza nivara TaxID=4536 RepID=A0A0E0I8S1_ORYNI